MFTPPSIFQNWQIWHQNKLTFIWNNLLWRQGKWTTPNIHRNNVLLITCGLLRHLRDSGVNNKYYLDIKRFKICWVQRILDSGRKELLWRGLGTKAKKNWDKFSRGWRKYLEYRNIRCYKLWSATVYIVFLCLSVVWLKRERCTPRFNVWSVQSWRRYEWEVCRVYWKGYTDIYKGDLLG